MEGYASFTMGAKARCADRDCGRVAQVVVDPIAGTVTHLIVEPGHRQGLGRLVPVEWAEPRDDHVDIRCTGAEFDALPIAEDVRFVESIEGHMGYGPEETLLWPYFGGNATVPVVVDTLPAGEVAVRRGEDVYASDGRIGEVEGLVVHAENHHASHIVLKEGHLFGRKQVAIPLAAVRAVEEHGIRLSMSKHDVEDLPAVDLRHPGR